MSFPSYPCLILSLTFLRYPRSIFSNPHRDLSTSGKANTHNRLSSLKSNQKSGPRTWVIRHNAATRNLISSWNGNTCFRTQGWALRWIPYRYFHLCHLSLMIWHTCSIPSSRRRRPISFLVDEPPDVTFSVSVAFNLSVGYFLSWIIFCFGYINLLLYDVLIFFLFFFFLLGFFYTKSYL